MVTLYQVFSVFEDYMWLSMWLSHHFFVPELSQHHRNVYMWLKSVGGEAGERGWSVGLFKRLCWEISAKLVSCFPSEGHLYQTCKSPGSNHTLLIKTARQKYQKRIVPFTISKPHMKSDWSLNQLCILKFDNCLWLLSELKINSIREEEVVDSWFELLYIPDF